jgi:ribose 5-phosphate isomerase B
MSRPQIHLAADHAGFAHKTAVREWLTREGFTIVDHGACTYNPDDDFPDFIALAAAAVRRAPEQTRGIIFGGSGQGEAMIANRFPAVRATVYYGGPDEIITLSREHNDANVLSIGARFVGIDESKRVIWQWLHAPTGQDQKYHRRNQKIESITRTNAR